MKSKIQNNIATIIAVIIVAISWWLLTNQTSVYRYKSSKAKHIQNFIHHEQENLKECLNDFEKLYFNQNPENDRLRETLIKELSDNDITICVYKNDSLKYWSKNSNISEINRLSKLPPGKCFSHDRSWYLSEHIHLDPFYISANFRIKQEFEYENHILKNSFHNGIKLNPKTIISKDKKLKPNIYGQDNEYLFSLKLDGSTTLPSRLQNIFLLLFILTSLLVLKILWDLLKKQDLLLSQKIFLISLFTIIVRLFTLWQKWPKTVYLSKIFDPAIYASSWITPSLGDMLINVILILTLLLIGYNSTKTKINYKKNYSATIFAFIVFAVSSFCLHYLFKSLISNSTKDFLMYDFVQMNSTTFVGFTTMIIFLGCYSLLSRITVSTIARNINFKQLITILTTVLVITLSYSLVKNNWNIFIESFLYSAYIIALYFLTIKDITKGFRFNLLLISILSVIGIFQIITNQYKKQLADSELIAGNLSNERDAVLESILPKLEKYISKDDLIPYYVKDIDKNSQEIFNYITTAYLKGYINKYDIQITGCYNETDLIINDTNNKVGCYTFFDSIINQSCIEVPETHFYYNNNHNGRVSYLGVIKFPIGHTKDSASVFIELESKLANRYLGYPELLIQSPRTNIAQAKGYSYANYNNNGLVSFSGEHDFPKTIYDKGKKSFNKRNYRLINGNLEYRYYINENNLIIITKPFILGYRALYLISHLFIGLYILFIIMYYRGSFYDVTIFYNSLSGRIKISIIGVLLFSLILISIGTLKFTTNNYEKYHLGNINEKVKSILVELEHKINTGHDKIVDNKEYLDYWLINFSNVFYTDINLYSPSGDLLATSREEIFEKDLICRKINRNAKEALDSGLSIYSCTEKIGTLEYSSVYVPFLNDKNKAIAYLNIPYFTRQNELQSQLYQLINAGVNIFIILALLAISIAVLISNRISKPIRMLQSGLSDLTIGGKNKTLNYNKKDEISQLVVAYNNKVNELQKSIEKLAEQEREDAWKKMSRQIAHEIKNPLTPMKLRVQFLERSLSEKPENIKDELKKFTKTMIQQIDSLTYIANQFANFSKISDQKPEELKPENIINNVLSLYSKTDNITFSTNFNCNKLIFADKELLPRVFINLIKNAIHSIPDDRDGKIEIGFAQKNDNEIEFYVKDNGKGINTENQSRLFEPNFTTKTSGMGLGLSIVKNIIENSGGKIWFDTVINQGTSFYFTIPIAK